MTGVIVLNGPGSVGKTTVAKALQSMASESYLHVSMDAFLQMLPAATFDDPRGLTFERIEEDGMPSVRIHSGPIADRAFRGMRHAIAAMAAEGNHLIVDDVAVEVEIAEYRQLLSAHHLVVVGLFAPLDVLERRERERADRLIGLSRWQHDRVHHGIDYDLRIDTALNSAAECAEVILRQVG